MFVVLGSSFEVLMGKAETSTLVLMAFMELIVLD